MAKRKHRMGPRDPRTAQQKLMAWVSQDRDTRGNPRERAIEHGIWKRGYQAEQRQARKNLKKFSPLKYRRSGRKKY